MIRSIFCALALCGMVPFAAWSQDAPRSGPLRIEITEGVVEPLPMALVDFLPASEAETELAAQVSRVVQSDLESSGLFKFLDSDAFISPITHFDSPIEFSDWRVINAEALVTGAVTVLGDEMEVKFRLFDVVAQQPLGEGLRFSGPTESWRRMGHKVADAIYSRITGETAYFDTRIVFVGESGPKDARQKRLAIMDSDGANMTYLTEGDALVLAPRMAPDGQSLLFTSYASGRPSLNRLDLSDLSITPFVENAMTFSARFDAVGGKVVYSQTDGGNTDLYLKDLSTGETTRLTQGPAIETGASLSPDGSQVIFESDRSGSQQLYVMDLESLKPQRISFGPGRYSTPAWSPRGDFIAFTKQREKRFHIGVMRTDGTEERLLTAAFLDEGPNWAPNGRVVVFTRQSPGATGAPQLYTVDITGRNLQRVPTETAASDPYWSPLLP